MSEPRHVQSYIFCFFPGQLRFAIYDEGGNAVVRVENTPKPGEQMSLRDFMNVYDAMGRHLHQLFDRPGTSPK